MTSASSALTQHIGIHLPNYPLGRRSTNGSCKPFVHYDRSHIYHTIPRFFAHDFDYENLSLRISEGGVVPRRTKNPFIEKKVKKKKKKGRTQTPNVKENGIEAGEHTETGPTSVLKLEEQAHEQEPRGNHEAEIGAPAQECVQRPNQTVEPSEMVGTPEEGVILEVGLTLQEFTINILTPGPQEEHMQAALATAQTLQAEEDALGEELGHHHDVRINRDPQKWVESPFLVVDPFIGTKVRSCGCSWATSDPGT